MNLMLFLTTHPEILRFDRAHFWPSVAARKPASFWVGWLRNLPVV